MRRGLNGGNGCLGHGAKGMDLIRAYYKLDSFLIDPSRPILLECAL